MALQKPKIEIPDPRLEAEKFYKENILDIRKAFEFYNTIVIGVFLIGFVILLFSLGTMLLQGWQMNSTFQTQLKQIQVQEDLIKNSVTQQKTMLDNQTALLQEIVKIKNYLGIQ